MKGENKKQQHSHIYVYGMVPYEKRERAGIFE
jgi:hypothetical protein